MLLARANGFDVVGVEGAAIPQLGRVRLIERKTGFARRRQLPVTRLVVVELLLQPLGNRMSHARNVGAAVVANAFSLSELQQSQRVDSVPGGLVRVFIVGFEVRIDGPAQLAGLALALRQHLIDVSLLFDAPEQALGLELFVRFEESAQHRLGFGELAALDQRLRVQPPQRRTLQLLCRRRLSESAQLGKHALRPQGRAESDDLLGHRCDAFERASTHDLVAEASQLFARPTCELSVDRVSLPAQVAAEALEPAHSVRSGAMPA